MTEAIIYTRDSCQPCRMTKKKFDELEIPYEEFQLEDLSDEELRVLTDSYGAKEAPVVMTAYDMWTGYRPDRIEGILN